MLNRKIKLLMVLLVMVLGALGLNAQDVIPAAGGVATGNDSASYTVGQLVFTTYFGSDGSLAQGVQQPYEISVETGVDDLNRVELTVLAYPNPTTDYLMLKVDATVLLSEGDLMYLLFDMQGKLLEQKRISGCEMRISMGHYIPSIYLLRVSDGGRTVKTFRIIKN